MEKKYKYKVGLYAQGAVEGYVELTETEANLISHATNPDNWEITKDRYFHAEFKIDIDNPVEIK